MGLSYTQTRLQMDIEDIIKPYDSSKEYNPYFIATAKIHTVEKDIGVESNVIVHSLKIERDYIENLHDYMELQLLIPPGVFFYDIYDYLNNLEVTLSLSKQLSDRGVPNIVSERYRAIYPLDKNKNYPNIQSQKREDLNQLTPFVVTLQLVDRSAEALRIKTTSGSFDPKITHNKDMSPSSVLKSIISTEASKILVENKPILDAIEIEPMENTEKLQAFILKSKTRVVELADYLQENNIGLYTGGVGSYLQRFAKDYKTFKKIYSVYSLYNTNKYDSATYKTIFYLPHMSTQGLSESITYKYEDGILKVLGHTSTRIEDKKDSLVLSYGTGFRSSQARSFMKKPVAIDINGNPQFKSENLVTQITYEDRADGVNFAPNVGINNNNFKLISDILKRKGSYINIEVNHLDPDYIFPAGKCKIRYENKENNLFELDGVIHKAYFHFFQEGKNVASRYALGRAELYCKAVIAVFCLDGGKNVDDS